MNLLSEGYSVRHAARTIGRTFIRFYQLKERDEDFALAWSQALEQGTQRLEDEALRRAVDGVEKPVYQGGEFVGTITEYSDRLLEFLLRGRRPAVYRDGLNLEVTGPNGGPLQIERDAERDARLYAKLVEIGLLSQVPQRLLPAASEADAVDAELEP